MNRQQGFSLIELAIVLVIVTLLVGGLAMPLSAQIQARRIAETKKIMEEAREAIFGYAMTHTVDHDGSALTLRRPTLPCPDTDGDGRENLTGTACTSDSGFFPWVDLGTATQDAWGNRLAYALDPDYGNRGPGNTFNNGGTGDKQICDTSVGSCNVGNVAAAVPVVLVSYGPNGWGARNVNGSTLQPPTSTDELENFSTSAGLDPLSYISRPPSGADSPAGEFDDLVVWISSPVLISRVCPVPGGCP